MNVTAYRAISMDKANEICGNGTWEDCKIRDRLGDGIYFYVGEDNKKPNDNHLKILGNFNDKQYLYSNELLFEAMAVEGLCRKLKMEQELSVSVVKKTVAPLMKWEKSTNQRTDINVALVHLCVRNTGCIVRAAIIHGEEARM